MPAQAKIPPASGYLTAPGGRKKSERAKERSGTAVGGTTLRSVPAVPPLNRYAQERPARIFCFCQSHSDSCGRSKSFCSRSLARSGLAKSAARGARLRSLAGGRAGVPRPRFRGALPCPPYLGRGA